VTDLRDPIEAWREVSATAARSTGYRAGRVARRWPGLASIGAMAVALAVIVTGLALRPVSAPSASGLVAAETDDGMFRLGLTTPHATYGPGDAITPVARVTYLGPDGAITVQHAHSQLVFQVEEVDGTRRMEGGSRLSCESTNLVKGEPLVVPFTKSGSPDDPAKDFDLAWYMDPRLTLPVGTWRIAVNMDFNVGGCGGIDHALRAANVITVVGDAAPSVGPSRIPSVAPTTSPATTPPTVPFSNEPVSGSVHDGAFRLELTTPHSVFGTQDAITPVAALTYLGPDASVTFGHADPAVVFTIGEIGGKNRQMGGGADDLCALTTLANGRPMTSPFQKGGALDTGFDITWFRDPVLHLPGGTWRIEARFAGAVPACDIGAAQHALTVENIISVVDDPATGPSPSVSADSATAVATVEALEAAVAANNSNAAWALLSPWSQTAMGTWTHYDMVVRAVAADPQRLVIGPPSQDPELLSVVFLGDRADDIAANADMNRAFLVSVRDPSIDGAAAATTNLVAAPLRADGTWRIWLDISGG
jgi:hypothetical protein